MEEGEAVEEDGMRAMVFHVQLPKEQRLLFGQGKGELRAQASPIGGQGQGELAQRPVRGRDGLWTRHRRRRPRPQAAARLSAQAVFQGGAHSY